MTLTPEQELENAIIKRNYYLVCDLLGLSEKERLHLNAGLWIVDFVKQMQTATMLIKSVKMRANENQKIENYEPETPLPKTPSIVNDIISTLTGGSDGKA